MINGVSLFANVGIAETYINNHDIKITVANELLKNRAEFHQQMHKECKMIQGDITSDEVFNAVAKEAKKQKCDFLIATPPCQGMSLAGKMQEDDPRNSLIKYVIKLAQELKPTNILIENVPKVLKTYLVHKGEKIKISDFIKKELEPLGYIINPVVVDAADYGTPQSRKRAIYLISKLKKWDLPPKEEKLTVRQMIEHLPPLESGESSDIIFHRAKVHNARHISFLKHTPTGKTALHNKVHYPKKVDGTRIKGYDTTYKRIEWDKPAPTITMANGSVSSQNNVHPGRQKKDGTFSDARVLTLKEIFILTGLPDDWTPPEWASENLIRQVIGEGVPPRLIDRLLSTIPKK
ncbi:DNA (cytosine-5-)-methyltransferase [Sulfurimonas aquatica]|uniref:DNA (cytosine-5-)-methyltransferase n=1 Tax=Sulfurimonas aquatica TaxID=2672570 RepID=A0A975B289_9BACT|nr:DNA cytosine methyltransferase [Sulfurimonas aquatica]QSZ42897.1 DNA (cytosine-5-)-methyltransferase [Sulfurimonas aquatica]